MNRLSICIIPFKYRFAVAYFSPTFSILELPMNQHMRFNWIVIFDVEWEILLYVTRVCLQQMELRKNNIIRAGITREEISELKCFQPFSLRGINFEKILKIHWKYAILVWISNIFVVIDCIVQRTNKGIAKVHLNWWLRMIWFVCVFLYPYGCMCVCAFCIRLCMYSLSNHWQFQQPIKRVPHFLHAIATCILCV